MPLRGPLAAALFALAVASPPALAADQPVVRTACGAYDAVPSGTGPSGKPTRLSIQKRGRLLQTVSDWSITRVACADLNGDRTLELLVTSFSGGAHCCETLRVWTLGSSPKLVLDYESGNAGGFELRDLDGSGRTELVVGDDSFAYFGDLSYECSPAYLPLVACPTDAGFEECTRRFPDLLRSWLARFEDRLRQPGADVQAREGAALGVLAIYALLGDESGGVNAVRKVADDEVMKWLERARPRVGNWVAARGRKLKERNER